MQCLIPKMIIQSDIRRCQRSTWRNHWTIKFLSQSRRSVLVGRSKRGYEGRRRVNSPPFLRLCNWLVRCIRHSHKNREIERKQKTRARGPVSKWLNILVAFSTRLSGDTESPMLSPFYNALLGSATGLVIFILIVFLVWIVRKRQIREEIKKKQMELRKRYWKLSNHFLSDDVPLTEPTVWAQ